MDKKIFFVVLLLATLVFVNLLFFNSTKKDFTGRATGPCVVDGICDAGFGENDVNCPEDCVSGGVTEDIPLGKVISGSTTYGFDWSLDDTDIPSLQDTQINFQNRLIDVHEELVLSNGSGPSVETSLTSQDDDYMSNIFLEVVSKGISYYYVFDNKINISKATATEPLTINFLGKDIKIINVNSNYKFTAIVDGVMQSFQEGDAYIGEDENDPDWEWIINGLRTDLATTLNVTQSEFPWQPPPGPVLGIHNSFTRDDDTDNPLGVGGCYNLPNNYVSICLDSLTVPDTDYLEITTKYTTVDTAKSGASGSLTNAKVIEISSLGSNGFIMKTNGWPYVNITNAPNNARTNQIWLQATSLSNVLVFYNDPNKNPSVVYAGNINGVFQTTIAELNFSDTKDNNFLIQYKNYTYNSTIKSLIFNISGDSSSELANSEEIILTNWSLFGGSFSGLGSVSFFPDPSELIWSTRLSVGNKYTPTYVNLGTKNKDLRTKYGIIVKNPVLNGASDQVVLLIPSDQVQANVRIFGFTTLGCTDSDNGLDYYTRGVTSGINSTGSSNGVVDFCVYGTNFLNEYYCDSVTNYVASVRYDCPYGCSGGMCLAARICIDSDNGINYDVKGTTTNWQGYNVTDYCYNSTTLNEFYCGTSGWENSINYTCSGVNCLNGACASATSCVTGCSIDSICVDVGYRTVIQGEGVHYCTTNGIFVPQKEIGADCQNNFECLSNFCSNSKCVDLVSDIQSNTGILNQILAFLQSK